MREFSCRTYQTYRHLARSLASAILLVLVAAFTLAPNAAQAFKEDWPYLHTSVGPHQVRVLNDGLVAFEQRLDMIEKSKTSIDCMVYLFGTDETGLLTLHSMMQKALAGVHVRLLLDWYTGAGKPDITEDIATAIQRELVRKAGPSGLKGSFEIRYYNRGKMIESLGRANHRNHAKVMITDSQELLVGGRNIGDDYFSLQEGGWEYIDRELWVKSVSTNPKANAALQATAAFDAYWNDEKWVSKAKLYDDSVSLSDDAIDSAALGDSDKLPEQKLRDRVRSTARGASVKTHSVQNVTFAIDKQSHKKSGRVVTPVINEILDKTDRYLMMENYSLPMSDARLDLMKSVAARKVPVLILTNGFEAHDSQGVSAFSQPQEASLLKSSPNVWIWAFWGKPLDNSIYLKGRKAATNFSTHTKTFVSYSNSKWYAVVGSYNFDVRSEKTNNESTLIIEDREVVREITEDIGYRMQSSHPLSVGENGRLYYSDTKEYQTRVVSDFKKVMNFIGLGKLLRSLY